MAVRLNLAHALLFPFLVSLVICGCNEGSDDGKGTGGTDCQNLPEPVVLRSCARLASEPTSTYGWPSYEHTFQGSVLAVGSASGADGCFLAEDSASGFSFQIADDTGTPWVVGVSFPGLAVPIAVGDVVSVEAKRQAGGFHLYKGVTRFVLRDANGALLVYVEDHNTVAGFEPPTELEVAAGSVECTRSDSCGEISARSFLLSVGPESASVPFATEKQIGPYLVMHGGLTEGDSTHSCPDWDPSHAALGVASLD